MRTLYLLSVIFLVVQTGAHSQESVSAKLIINADQGEHTISRHIYGHFSEHLGRCIYGGFYVGENSPIPNVRGIRTDIVEALRNINIPNLRWPGGCFADEYHWMDGIGPKELRPKMINTHWGGVVEDNSFGTHEFMDLCEQLGTEPYICGNVGSGTVEEMAKWVEYMTFDGESPMANLRRENGRQEPWAVKYWGVGNENWGCGGHMTAEYYADLYKRYATYCRNYGKNRLYKVAGGPNSDDYHWMEVMMKNIPYFLMQGVSLHYYTVTNTWTDKGSATDFNKDDYLRTISKCFHMDELITKHSRIMDRYDPGKRVGLIFDEWGTWHNVEPDTNPGFLYQQNTLRDALVAAIGLNIFNSHCDRVKMANIAQTINVLQALILTKEENMILTPTYHVFDMYKVHHDALLLPFDLQCDNFETGIKSYPFLHATVSKNDKGRMHISVVNIDPDRSRVLSADIRGGKYSRVIKSSIITAKEINTFNSFDAPDNVKIQKFSDAKYNRGELIINLPPKSIITIELE